MNRLVRRKLVLTLSVGVTILISYHILGTTLRHAENRYVMMGVQPHTENEVTSEYSIPSRKSNYSKQIFYNTIFQDKELINYDRTLQQNIQQYWNNKENVYRILDMKPIEFNRDFKNPCWVGHQGNGPIADNKIHCLPYFYILGMDRTVATDLFSRLCRHPLVQSPGYEELHWFSRLRFGRADGRLMRNKQIQGLVRKGPDAQSVNFYVSMFDPIARFIDSLQPKMKKANGIKHSVITGDATLSTILENPRWQLWPGNEGLPEPRYTNLHLIKHLTPNAKIIILFRDPIDRLFSEFNSMIGGNDTIRELFHSQVVLAVGVYKDCFQRHTIRRCAYNETIKEYLKQRGVLFAESFHGGFYPFVIREVYSVFDNENVLPLVLYDKSYNMVATMKRLLIFLSLGSPTMDIMNDILQDEANQGTKNDIIMLQETEQILKDFFKPLNKEMANTMKSDRYLFYN